MAKKLTLDETWTLCLQMWKWIAEQIPKKPVRLHISTFVWNLKAKWLQEHSVGSNIENNCFFCDWATRYKNEHCNSCPAKKVDKNFGDCYDENYSFETKPIEFYHKIDSLHKIYKAQKSPKKARK